MSLKDTTENEADIKALDTDPDPSPKPGARRLRAYWTRGAGAAKIGWGTPGDWRRCVAHLSKYVSDPKGLCTVYHHSRLGYYPGDRRNKAYFDALAVAYDAQEQQNEG